MRISRIDNLEQYILEHKAASIDALCEEFGISKNTVRRDLEVLVSRGSVEKVYGGVVAAENAAIIPELVTFHERANRNLDGKQRIAQLAASYVRERDTIFIDSGTTTMNIVDYLTHLASVTVITASIQVINKSMNHPNINLIVLPGTLKRDTASLIGSSCLEYLEDFNIARGFMTCTGFSIQSGVCNASTEEYSIKKAALKKCQKRYLLADSSKYGKTSLMTFGEISQFNYLITDQGLDEDFCNYCKEVNCAIRIAAAD